MAVPFQKNPPIGGKSKYAQAGVDFEKEHEVVGILKALREKTLPFTKDLVRFGITFTEDASDFSGGFQVNTQTMLNSGIWNYVMQQCTDGPGSKPVAHALYNGNDPIKLGCTSIDSIAMVVNDLICSGARPVTLVEYHSWHDISIEIARQMAVGNLRGAELAKATIIGGENASLSTMITGPIPDNAYDMCHMATGIVFDKDIIVNPLGKNRVEIGDIAIGLSSSGIHCNGVTLGWKTPINYAANLILANLNAGGNNEYAEADKINDHVEELGESVAEALLTPTIIYVEPILEILEEYGGDIHAIANITGEGVHNMKRVLPKGTELNLDYSRSAVQQPHPFFRWIQENADVSTREMYEDYNMGTGMVVLVENGSAEEIIDTLNGIGQQQTLQPKFKAYDLGVVKASPGSVEGLVDIVTYDNTLEAY